MKKITFLKTLLVAVGLLTGVSAWADDVNATLEHTAGSQWGKNTGASTVDVEKEHYNNDDASSWAGCAYAKFSYTIPSGHSIKKATLTYSVNQGGRSGRNDIIYYMAKDFDIDWDNFAGQTGTDLRYTGSRKGKAVASAPTGGTGDRSNLSQDISDAVRTLYSEGQSYIILQWTGNAGGADLYGKASANAPTLVIETADASSVTTYKVVFTDGTDELKTAVVYDGITIGSEQTASATDMASFVVGDKKYIYKSGNTTITTVADATENVITLVFREAAIVNYTLTDNTTNTELTTGKGFEADVVSAYYPHYVLKDNILYNCPKQSDNPWYGLSITLGTTDMEESIDYSATDISNVVFYSEGETIEGASVNRGGNYSDIRSFGGAVGYAPSDLTITTLAPGKYVIKADLFTPTSALGSQKFSVGEQVFTLTSTNNGYHNELTTEIFEVTTPTDVIWLAGGGATSAVDWLYIQKIITEVTPSSNATGFLTFASDYALDFSATETKAYIATAVADSKVQLTQVTKVPAGTGLILERANESTEAIPVLSGDADDVSANKLARGTGAAVDAGYVLVNRTGEAQFAGIGDTDKPVVAKDQAYLNIAAEAPYLQFVFAGAETTGINDVRGKMADVRGEVYNLNGQRVAKPTKGLYIVNGKKVIVK